VENMSVMVFCEEQDRASGSLIPVSVARHRPTVMPIACHEGVAWKAPVQRSSSLRRLSMSGIF
jgi:hypothetical protein